MTEEQQMRKKKVLVAEDDEITSRAYQEGLEGAGYEVILAVNGEEAVRRAKEHKPDIILLDLIMPETSGFEALEAIKEDESLKLIPVIILTNLGQDSDVAKGRELGAVDYLIKTNTSMKDVIEKVNGYLQ